ncbi:MAG TPA: DUF4097 family beta strand repeat-containing protein [Gemmatimonadaceae bacterium]
MRLTFTALVLACAAPLAAQQADFHWEKQLSADKTVSLHNLNGRITVTPSTSGKVEIIGTRHGGRRAEDVTIEVYESDRGITACSMFKTADMECDDDGMHMHDNGWGRRGRDRDRDWDDASIDMEVKVPKGMRVSASNVSGNVRIVGMEGNVRGGSVSGDVRMESLRATSVRASSVSGDVSVDVDNLSGDGSLNFSSVSGSVTVQLPKNLDADVSMRSVSGSLDSDFPLTLNGRVNRSSINARIGKGGRELEIHTVSGDVRLRMAK